MIKSVHLEKEIGDSSFDHYSLLCISFNLTQWTLKVLSLLHDVEFPLTLCIGKIIGEVIHCKQLNLHCMIRYTRFYCQG